MPHLTELYDVALLDLDGVVYIGPRPVPHAPEALRQAREAGMRLAFVTNNASRPPDRVAAHLTEIGVEARPEEVVTSAQAAARLLAEQLPAGSKVLVVGGEGLEVALREQDLVPVSGADDGPVAVVQGFSPKVGWPLLAEGTYAVASGLPWVASNTDPIVPTDRGRAPGNGTLVDAIRTATGRDPVVAGKPEPPMHREAILRSGATRPLVVGDRLDTDIEGANAAEVDSLLVLTGVTDPIDVVLAPARLRPTYVGHDLRSLHASPGGLRVGAGDATVGDWHAVVDGGTLRLTRAAADGSGPGDGASGGAGSGGEDDGAEGDGAEADRLALDGLRAVCGAVWAAADDAGAGGAAVDAGGAAVDRASVQAALDAARTTRAPARPY
ncbi:HAD superfamily hydrolase (TIGR01450 family) [Jiangella mangrovi]|uniref:HAD superfamily hydrolase (TIGR01450 family) n=1 Tax=Jiangella mangrovi TaxID=1524084 RepID=A0A7W9LPL8_9ACTN|nr:HAD superfamily hydrolase (TIGR01450 family) [Jiangella mangrovi]